MLLSGEEGMALWSNSYFMRVFYWDNDEDYLAPVYIKIPLAILTPHEKILRFLTSLEEYFKVECYLVIDNIEENFMGGVGYQPFGLATPQVSLITTKLTDEVEAICGMSWRAGEFEILAWDNDQGFVVLEADEGLANYLGLEYLEDVTELHDKFLASIGCDDEKDFVYFPTALYP